MLIYLNVNLKFLLHAPLSYWVSLRESLDMTQGCLPELSKHTGLGILH